MNKASGANGGIAPLRTAPKSIAPIARKINEIVRYCAKSGAGGIVGRAPIGVTVGDSGSAIIEIDEIYLSKIMAENAKSRGGGGGVTDTSALESRIAALEAKLNGYASATYNVCVSGSTVTKTFLVK